MGNPVGWFEIYVQDMKRARAFYEAVFGLTLAHMDMPGMEMWTFPMEQQGSSGISGALIRMQGLASGGNSTIVYFSCKDCGVEAGKASRAGGRVHKEKTSIGQHGFFALVLDTEGNMIGLHSME
jgi:uncharacterized protein